MLLCFIIITKFCCTTWLCCNCIKDRLCDRPLCRNLHPCVIKFSQFPPSPTDPPPNPSLSFYGPPKSVELALARDPEFTMSVHSCDWLQLVRQSCPQHSSWSKHSGKFRCGKETQLGPARSLTGQLNRLHHSLPVVTMRSSW